MSSIRKVVHASGTQAWRATWINAAGGRQSKNFALKGDAKAHLRLVDIGLSGASATMTVAELANDHLVWFEGLVKKGVRERVTLDGYQTALDRHVKADGVFAKTKLCDLTTPVAQRFLDALFARASTNVTRKTRGALILWCEHGQRRGLLVANPLRATKVEVTQRREGDEDDAREIPPKSQLTALIKAAAEGPNPERDTAALKILMFAGLRISELLGLSEASVSADRVRVVERLDSQYRRLGKLKSAKARRDVPIGPDTAKAIKIWRVRRGISPATRHFGEQIDGRLFPCPGGCDVWGYHEFRQDLWIPLMERAGLLERIKDDKGVPRPIPAFGPHVLRHVAASLWIAQDLTPKRVQHLLGHSSMRMTMDTYGHFWEDRAGDEALASASERLISG